MAAPTSGGLVLPGRAEPWPLTLASRHLPRHVFRLTLQDALGCAPAEADKLGEAEHGVHVVPQPGFRLGVWGQGRGDNGRALSPTVLLSLASEGPPPHLRALPEYPRDASLSETSSCLGTLAQAVPTDPLPENRCSR